MVRLDGPALCRTAGLSLSLHARHLMSIKRRVVGAARNSKRNYILQISFFFPFDFGTRECGTDFHGSRVNFFLSCLLFPFDWSVTS